MATKRNRTRQPSIMAPAQPASVAAAPAAPMPRTGTRADNVNWAEEYSYVVRDVRYLLIVSAILFAALLLLGLLI